MGDRRWEFVVVQDGIEVAKGWCPDEDMARKECLHYCMMYGQDGYCDGSWRPEERRKGERRVKAQPTFQGRYFVGADWQKDVWWKPDRRRAERRKGE